MEEHYRIRPATPGDASAIAALERQIFTDPWPESALVTPAGDLSLVACVGGSVVAYVFVRAAEDEAEVLNVAVHPARRRRGIGRALLTRALARCAVSGVRAVHLEVRASNDVAQAFYRQMGFQQAGRRPRYYTQPAEDALVLRRILGPREHPA